MIIHLNPSTIECCVCGLEDEHHWALATYEDIILPNEWSGEWKGTACCRRCSEAWKLGVIKPGMTFAQANEAVIEAGLLQMLSEKPCACGKRERGDQQVRVSPLVCNDSGASARFQCLVCKDIHKAVMLIPRIK